MQWDSLHVRFMLLVNHSYTAAGVSLIQQGEGGVREWEDDEGGAVVQLIKLSKAMTSA